MLWEYLYDKDPLIFSYAPSWVSWGLQEAVAAAIPEGGTLKLGPDEWEADAMREAAKKGTKMTARQVMEAPMEKLFEAPAGTTFAARLVRYFLASKKDFLVNYLKATIEVASEFDKTKAGKVEVAKTEEEEEAQLKARKVTAISGPER